MHAPAVMERIAQEVPALGGRLYDALTLASIIDRNQLPQVTPAAFVLPLGMRGGAVSSASGLYRQPFDDVVGVIIVMRVAGEATGGDIAERVSAIAKPVIRAVCGWAPPFEDGMGATDVFRLAKAEFVNLAAGAAIYQIDFAVPSQFRF